MAVKKLSDPFQGVVHAKRCLRELKLLTHMNHENVSCSLCVVCRLLTCLSVMLSARSHPHRLCHCTMCSLRQTITKTLKTCKVFRYSSFPRPLTYSSLHCMKNPRKIHYSLSISICLPTYLPTYLPPSLPLPPLPLLPLAIW